MKIKMLLIILFTVLIVSCSDSKEFVSGKIVNTYEASWVKCGSLHETAISTKKYGIITVCGKLGKEGDYIEVYIEKCYLPEVE